MIIYVTDSKILIMSVVIAGITRTMALTASISFRILIYHILIETSIKAGKEK